jgi:hypothetical protein
VPESAHASRRSNVACRAADDAVGAGGRGSKPWITGEERAIGGSDVRVNWMVPPCVTEEDVVGEPTVADDEGAQQRVGVLEHRLVAGIEAALLLAKAPISASTRKTLSSALIQAARRCRT